LREYRRSAIAGGLIGAAVLVPTAAWYIVGTREATDRAVRLQEGALIEVRDLVTYHAARLASRLDALRVRESERPFYHYQNLYHDPGGAAEGLAVVRSPLASGAPDPLVLAHFQIDDRGQVSLPSVNDSFPELSAEADIAAFCRFLSELEHGMLIPSFASESDPDTERVQVLDRAEWDQYVSADAVYASLTGRETGAASTEPASTTRMDAGENGPVVVRVGSLRWRTLVIESGPVLAAVRQVATPRGVLAQGFAVSPAGVMDWTDAKALGVELSPEPGADLGTAAAVADTGWYLVADPGPAIELASADGRRMSRQFQHTFGLAALAVCAAGLAAVLVVAHSEWLARQRARFAASAAHELKTPLTTLRLYSEMLSEETGDPRRAHEYSSRIAAETARLGRLVTNMLDLARLERGSLQVRPELGDLEAAVRETVSRLQPAVRAEGLEVEVEAEQGLPAVSFDRDALDQILHNLLDNAEKYTRGCARRVARVAVAAHPGGAALTVTDTGRGLSGRARRRLFRSFARDPREDETAGLGLGLPLARALARAQDGDLVYVPGPTGTSFRVEFASSPTQ